MHFFSYSVRFNYKQNSGKQMRMLLFKPGDSLIKGESPQVF